MASPPKKKLCKRPKEEECFVALDFGSRLSTNEPETSIKLLRNQKHMHEIYLDILNILSLLKDAFGNPGFPVFLAGSAVGIEKYSGTIFSYQYLLHINSLAIGTYYATVDSKEQSAFFKFIKVE
jgi:hypothetical protein